MKTLTILLTLLVASSAGAQQKKYTTFPLGLKQYQQITDQHHQRFWPGARLVAQQRRSIRHQSGKRVDQEHHQDDGIAADHEQCGHDHRNRGTQQ